LDARESSGILAPEEIEMTADGKYYKTRNRPLSVFNLQPSSPNAHAYYHADGNGNITALINGLQFIVAKYEYDPFGAILSSCGPLADANLYRFSSKEYHVNSGLIYCLYRFYDPNLQRWNNRDPIAEIGGVNLYAYCGNDSVDWTDPLGLDPSGSMTFTYANGQTKTILVGDPQNGFQPGYMKIVNPNGTVVQGTFPITAEQDAANRGNSGSQVFTAGWNNGGRDAIVFAATLPFNPFATVEEAMAFAAEREALEAAEAAEAVAAKGLRAAEDAAKAAKICPTKAIAPIDKFSKYIFKEGATHGKDAVFRGLGYSADDSAQLAKMWEDQASAKYAQGDYTLGKLDQYGQRINITIDVPGVGPAAGKTSSLTSGWMIRPDGSITLNTPFSGFPK
jgi:RHS repeat-associated protein